MDTHLLHSVLCSSPMPIQTAIWKGYMYLLHTKKGYVSPDILKALCLPSNAQEDVVLPVSMNLTHLMRVLYSLPTPEQFAIVEAYCNPGMVADPSKWKGVDRIYYASCGCGDAMVTKNPGEEVAWYAIHTKQKGHAGVTGTATTIPSPILTHWHWV